jgi:hypothetical protein
MGGSTANKRTESSRGAWCIFLNTAAEKDQLEVGVLAVWAAAPHHPLQVELHVGPPAQPCRLLLLLRPAGVGARLPVYVRLQRGGPATAHSVMQCLPQ